MALQELVASPRAVQFLHRAAWRRYRISLTTVTILLFLSTIWFYSDSAFYDGFPAPHRTSEYTKKVPHGDRRKPKPSGGSPSPFLNSSNDLISPKIWQIVLPKNPGDLPTPEGLENTASWLALNPEYTYTLVGQKGGQQFVESRFADKPAVIQAYNTMPNVGMKSDLLRYLILGAEGGVYTDTDTVALKSIDKWVPAQYRGKVRLLVGIEFDRRDGSGWADIPHDLQFCQWTIAAAPGHPVFPAMVDRILDSLDGLSKTHNVSVPELKPTSMEVMNSTGPAAWTDVVFEQLQGFNSSLNTTRDLAFMTEPRLFGDILVLTIDGFGMGQQHSDSTNDGSIPEAALMKHLFHGSWRGGT